MRYSYVSLFIQIIQAYVFEKVGRNYRYLVQGFSREKNMGREDGLFFPPTTHRITFPQRPTTYRFRDLHIPTSHWICQKYKN